MIPAGVLLLRSLEVYLLPAQQLLSPPCVLEVIKTT
jgi:hypothetical protein